MLSKRTLAGISAGAGLGLLLAGLSVGLWWGLEARHQPVRIVEQADSFEAVLTQAPAVVLGQGERPVYIIGSRDSAAFESWAVTEAAALLAKGRGVRVVVTPSGYGGTAEEATVAEIWLRPRLALWREWMSQRAELWTAAGLVPVRRDPVRQEALAKAQDFARQVAERAGSEGRGPLIVWRDPVGALVVCVCDTEQAQSKARMILGLGGQIETALTQDAQGIGSPQANDTSEAVVDYPYPQGLADKIDPAQSVETEALNEAAEPLFGEGMGPPPKTPTPLLPGDPVPNAAAPKPTATGAAPAKLAPRQRQTGREINTAPPEARKDSESLFY